MTRTQLDLFETKYDVIDQSVHPQFWAYQAGMADGDGSFQMKRKGKCITYVLSLIDKNIVKELSDLYNVKLCKPKSKKSHHKQRYIVNLCGSNARHFYNKVYPYLIEKRDVVKKYAKAVDLKLEDGPTSINYKLCWLAGYFDAEGSVSMQASYDKKTKKYYFKFRLRFTSTDLKVNRYVRRLLNTVFNRNGTKPMANLFKKTKWKIRPYNEKDCWDVTVTQAVKVHLFSKVFLPTIKCKRKKDKFKRIIDYAKFCAHMRWTFGSHNFKTNDRIRKRWLKFDEVEQAI